MSDLHLKKIKKKENVPKNYKRKGPGEYSKLNQYAKKQILYYLQEYGSGKILCEKLLKKFSCDPFELEKFVNTHAQNSQNSVKIECDSPTLHSLISWIEGFKNSDFKEAETTELSLIIRSISHLENHPRPEDCGGVDFQELYLFIATVMNGQPSVELNEKNRIFLCDVLGEIIDDINTGEGDLNTMKFRDDLLNSDLKDRKGMTLDEQMLQTGLNPLFLEFP